MTNLSIKQYKQETKYSCVPACLQAVLKYYNKQVSQEEILNSLDIPERGMSIPAAGTFAIKRGLHSVIITNNTDIFQHTWQNMETDKLVQYLSKRKKMLDKYNQSVVDDLLEYLKVGGQLTFDPISKDIFTKNLLNKTPVIIELSSADLYKKNKPEEEIEGHGVVIAGVDKNKFKIIDPDLNNPYDEMGVYWISVEDVLTSFNALEGKSILLVTK